MDRKRDIFIACSVGDLDWLERSLTGCEKNIGMMVNHEGLTPLHVAAKCGHVLVLQYLLDKCPNVNPDIATFDFGETPLHSCLQLTSSLSCIVQCVQLLLDRGANSNKANKNAQTPIHIATENGLIEVVKLLFSSGADDTVKDINNHTPLDLAKLNCHYECARLLQALYWAHHKDSATQMKLHVQRTLKEQMRVQVVLQREVKERENQAAYKEWLEVKGLKTQKMDINKPQRKKERLPSDKGTMNNALSNRTDPISKEITTENQEKKKPLISKIEISLNQAEHNILAVGKPDKLYPYSNYPPKTYRNHKQLTTSLSRPSSSMSGKQRGYKRQRSSSRMSTKSMPTPRHGGSTPTPPTIQSNSSSLPPSYQDYSIHKPIKNIHEPISSLQLSANGYHDNGINNEEEKHNSEELEEEEENGSTSSIDGLTFHEVGPENNLRTLIGGEPGPNQSATSPIAVTNTAAALFELFRLSHQEKNTSSYQRLSRRHSTGTRYGSRRQNNYQRTFSLNAIPEGEIVTKYDDQKEGSGSRLFDETFLSSLMPYAFGMGTSENEEERTLIDENFQTDITNKNQINEIDNDIDSIEAEPNSAVSPSIVGNTNDTLKVITVAWDEDTRKAMTLKLEEKPLSPRRPSTPSPNANFRSFSDSCLSHSNAGKPSVIKTTDSKVQIKSAINKSTNVVHKNRQELLQRDPNRHVGIVLKTTLYKFGDIRTN